MNMNKRMGICIDPDLANSISCQFMGVEPFKYFNMYKYLSDGINVHIDDEHVKYGITIGTSMDMYDFSQCFIEIKNKFKTKGE